MSDDNRTEQDGTAQDAAAQDVAAQDGAEPRVVTPDGEDVPVEAQVDTGEEVSRIEEPAKVMRIGGMIKRLLDEVRDSPLDEAARTRLAEIHERSIHELEDGLSPDLIDELHRITLPFSDEATPSDAELRVAQAQLVGWLEGLFHGIQTALVAQQMAAQAQLSQMRRGLPPGVAAGGFPGAQHPGAPGPDERPGPGQYL